MIAYIKGEIADITEDNLVLEANSIGYNIKISSGTAGMLPGIGEEVKIYTYTCVREDAFHLYGFLTKDDLDIFKKLITVNGIGPKGGLAILSVMSADSLRFAIISGDVKEISKAPGIGKKTAERVILDLRDKVSIEDTFVNKSMGGELSGASSGDTSSKNEAIEALTALGYSASEALKAVKQIAVTEDMDTEDILKLALKKI
ncbi:Holliday junction DNA helicase subunit RuvA [Kineothrix alysoides]|uniref:Holliday junction branch migration complex subunit RuvA n=1 Tax=Kineothrix alysoides TaxID=1469948 RepID=A0A4V2QC07_9FIRM|nr:Holliday junction branch migration protein RuvA [Kineothrix alysoides]TCL58467.1 Holliday junction DNA helicase subunit RuvA [Kineothrix alysoides]